MDGNLVWLAFIVLISYTTQAMSGFGSTILALTLGVHLYSIKVLLPVLVSVKYIMLLLPVILIGILLGEWLHQRIDEFRFRVFVFAVLLLAGASICLG